MDALLCIYDADRDLLAVFAIAGKMWCGRLTQFTPECCENAATPFGRARCSPFAALSLVLFLEESYVRS